MGKYANQNVTRALSKPDDLYNRPGEIKSRVTSRHFDLKGFRQTQYASPILLHIQGRLQLQTQGSNMRIWILGCDIDRDPR